MPPPGSFHSVVRSPRHLPFMGRPLPGTLAARCRTSTSTKNARARPQSVSLSSTGITVRFVDDLGYGSRNLRRTRQQSSPCHSNNGEVSTVFSSMRRIRLTWNPKVRKPSLATWKRLLEVLEDRYVPSDLVTNGSFETPLVHSLPGAGLNGIEIRARA